jgi:hypothetical protein
VLHIVDLCVDTLAGAGGRTACHDQYGRQRHGSQSHIILAQNPADKRTKVLRAFFRRR